jgi:hypothetical protein
MQLLHHGKIIERYCRVCRQRLILAGRDEKIVQQGREILCCATGYVRLPVLERTQPRRGPLRLGGIHG